jgi:predicted amidohydrolase
MGGIEAFADPRKTFVLAGLIDAANPQLSTDWNLFPPTTWNRDRVGLRPKAFFDGIANPPPPIGQMSAVQVAQRWMQNLMVLGDLSKLEGLGPFPLPDLRQAQGRTFNRLQDALDDGELRFAMIAWRRHEASELNFEESPPGCFRVDGLKTDATVPIEEVLDEVRRSRAHIALFPELSLNDDDYRRLCDWLKRESPRYPVLTVAPRTHQQEDGRLANLAVLLSASGRILLEHRKREPFTFDRPPPDLPLLEAIDPPGSAVQVLDTPVGRIAINICRDVRSDVPMLVNRILNSSLVLVPAYSHKLEFALEEGRLLGQRHRAILCAVNPYNRSLAHGAALYGAVRGAGSSKLVDWPEDEQAADEAQVPILTWTCRIGGRRGGEVGDPKWVNC